MCAGVGAALRVSGSDGDAPFAFGTAVAAPGLQSGELRLCVEGDDKGAALAVPPASLAVAAAAATRVEAWLRTPTAHASRPAARVAFQLFDADGNTRVAAPASLVLRLAFGAGGAPQEAACARGARTASGVGAARVRRARRRVLASEARTATLLQLVVDGVTHAQPLRRRSRSRRRRPPRGRRRTNFVIGGQLPAHPVFAGDTFDLKLLAKSDEAVGGGGPSPPTRSTCGASGDVVAGGRADDRRRRAVGKLALARTRRPPR